MNIGAQLYTVRAAMQTQEDIALTLRRIADIGYQYVQLSGHKPMDPMWMKAELDRNGLRCVLTHTAPDRLVSDFDAVAQEHDLLDCRYVGLGGYAFHTPDHSENTFDEYVGTYAPVAKAMKERGKLFMHHNHAREFIHEDGVPIIQKLAEAFPPDEMGFTLDTYWVQRGGGNPAEWLDRLKGRVPCIHLKDYGYLPEDKCAFAVLGEGNLNFDAIFAAAERAGTEYMLVEQDDCYGEDPFDCLRRSYEYLRSFGF